MLRKLLPTLALALGAALPAVPAMAAPSFSFSPSSSHIDVGDTVTIEMRLSGLGSEVLSGFDLNFQWGSAILGWTEISLSPIDAQIGIGVVDIDSVVPGDVGVQGISWRDDAALAASQADDFLFATLTLQGLADGVTVLSLGPDLDFERNFVGLNAASLGVAVGSACIAVGSGACAVPEPGSFSLLAAALGAAFGVPALRRRSSGVVRGRTARRA